MISEKLKDLSYYSKNKIKFNRKYNFKWKSIAGADYLGNCSFLFQEFMKEWNKNHNGELPVHDDFAHFYMSKTNPNKKGEGIKHPESREYGRSLEELIEIAKVYMELCGDYSIPFEEYFDDVVNHAIIETFNGQIREIMLREVYEKKGYSVERLNGKWDKDFGVDSIIRNKEGNIVDYIQCKPLTTFIGTHNKSLIEDRKYFFQKEKNKKKECDKLGYPYFPTKFIIYKTDIPDKWCCIGKKKSFLIEELCDIDGMPLHNAEDFTLFSFQ